MTLRPGSIKKAKKTEKSVQENAKEEAKQEQKKQKLRFTGLLQFQISWVFLRERRTGGGEFKDFPVTSDGVSCVGFQPWKI